MPRPRTSTSTGCWAGTERGRRVGNHDRSARVGAGQSGRDPRGDRPVTGVREFGADDWVQFIDIGHLLIDETGANDNLVERGAQAAAELVRRGIVTPGDITDDGFVPWSVSPKDAIEYIHRQASGISKERQFFWPGDIFWFQTDNYQEI